MRITLPTLSGAALLLALAPQAFAASAVIVGPSSNDPIQRQAIQNSPGAFTITNSQQASIVRFQSDGPNQICNRLSGGIDAGAPVALGVQWNGRSAVVMPGQCVTINAASARVAPAGPLTAGTVLHGT